MSLARAGSLLAALVLALSAPAAQPQTPVRILTGYPPGGGVDALARLFGEKLAEGLGRTVVVETRAGASGQIASEALKAAAPDGNTLMVAPDSAMTLYPHTAKKPAYDTLVDFTPVAHIGISMNGFAVNASIPASDLREFVNWAKAGGKPVPYGSGGYGSNQHFLGLMLGQATGVVMVHVPYRGVGPVVADLVAGQVPAGILPLGVLLPQARAGKIRILAHSGGRRSSVAADIPTFKELGYPTMESPSWYGIFARAGTRPEVIARYNEIVVQATRTQAVRDRMRNLDLEPREMTPAEIAAMVKSEYERWGPIVRGSGFSADSQ